MAKRLSHWMQAIEGYVDIFFILKYCLEGISPIVFSYDNLAQIHEVRVFDFSMHLAMCSTILVLPCVPPLSHVERHPLFEPFVASQSM